MYHISSAVHCIYMKWVQFQIFSVFRHAMSVPPSFALSLSSAISIPIQLSVFDCVITLSMTVMSAVSWRGIRVHPFPPTEPRYRRCKQSWLALLLPRCSVTIGTVNCLQPWLCGSCFKSRSDPVVLISHREKYPRKVQRTFCPPTSLRWNIAW